MSRNTIIILPRFRYVTMDGVWNGKLDLLAICIHRSELRLIAALSIISTSHKSPQHPLSLFPACCVFNSCSLAKASNNEDSSASRDHVVTVRRISRNWTLVNCQLSYSAISSHPPLQSSTSLPTFNWLGPRLATTSHQPSSLPFTGWLSTDNWYHPTTSLHSTELTNLCSR
jgi:hypothetical protein